MRFVGSGVSLGFVLVLGLAGCRSSPAGAAIPSPRVPAETSGARYASIAPDELAGILNDKDFFFVNTHIPYEGEIAQTDAFIAYDQMEQSLSQLPADRKAKIVLYCRSGRMSAIAAESLTRLGFTNVWDLEGGMIAWESAGFPLQGE